MNRLPTEYSKLNRRDFLTIAAIGLGSLATSVLFLHRKNEINDPVIDRIQVPIKGLHPSLDGFRIALMADFHLYPITQLDLIENSVAMANSLKPDLTVLVGDFVWRTAEAVFDLAPALAKLDARHGVFLTLGNHDYWLDVDLILTGFREVGLPVLINQGFTLAEGKGSLYIAGLDDGWSGKPDLVATMQSHKEGVPVILLLHEPDLADPYSLDGRMSLQLAGHTHGGQIRILGMGSFITPHLGHKYDRGLFKVNDMWLYTNRGIGVISIPARYNCPPEVTEITLVQS